MSVSFVADTEIAAPAARVWDILMDLPGYAAWNPFTYRAEGRPAVGEDVHLDVDLGWIHVHQVERVRAVEPGHLIAWGTPSAAAGSSAGCGRSAWCRSGQTGAATRPKTASKGP